MPAAKRLNKIGNTRCDYMNKYKHNSKNQKILNVYKYALVFNNADNMLDFICNTKFHNIINSKLYTRYGTYQIIITSMQRPNKNLKIATFQDKLHISEIKKTSRLICKNNIILKIQTAFGLK